MTMNDDEPVVSIGRIVHYVSYGTPGGEFTSECRAAIVTKVEANEYVDLCVMNPDWLFFNHRVGRVDSVKQGGSWHWPERT